MTDRLARLRTLMAEQQVEALLVTGEANRRYLSGFTGSAGALLITPDDALLLTDARYVEQAAQQAPHFRVVPVTHTTYGRTVAEEARKRGVRRIAFEAHRLTYAAYSAYREALPEGVELVPLGTGGMGLVERLRVVKDDGELALIRKAAAIVDAAFEHILSVLRPGLTEREVAWELEAFMRKQGAERAAFPIIVASGPRSALPHGVASDRVIGKGELVTLDFGAVYQGYCSDLTRTVAVGEPPEELKKIYEIVRQAQERGVAHVKAGMTGKEADALCRDVIAAAGYGEQFGHSTGHGIGLEVHEAPSLSARSEEPLPVGAVVTVEPGIYLPGVGGVRIEDDVVLTATGNECLTHAPKDLIMVT